MKYKLALVPIFLLLLACEDDTSIIVCGTENPIEDIEWLSLLVKEYEQLEQDDPDLAQYFYISQAQYEGETIIILPNCCPFCDTAIPAYNCQGDLIGVLGTSDRTIDIGLLESDIILWKPDNFSCSE